MYMCPCAVTVQTPHGSRKYTYWRLQSPSPSDYISPSVYSIDRSRGLEEENIVKIKNKIVERTELSQEEEEKGNNAFPAVWPARRHQLGTLFSLDDGKEEEEEEGGSGEACSAEKRNRYRPCEL